MCCLLLRKYPCKLSCKYLNNFEFCVVVTTGDLNLMTLLPSGVVGKNFKCLLL